jgi:hypothetical protein
LLETGLPAAPIHHDGGPHALHRQGKPLNDEDLAALVADVRESIVRATDDAFDALTKAIRVPIASLSLRAWPEDFPTDIATQRRVPYESRADSVMYRQVMAERGRSRGWALHLYEARDVEADAARLLGPRAREVLHGPRTTLGPPWSKDHRTALAATVIATESL